MKKILIAITIFLSFISLAPNHANAQSSCSISVQPEIMGVYMVNINNIPNDATDLQLVTPIQQQFNFELTGSPTFNTNIGHFNTDNLINPIDWSVIINTSSGALVTCQAPFVNPSVPDEPFPDVCRDPNFQVTKISDSKALIQGCAGPNATAANVQIQINDSNNQGDIINNFALTADNTFTKEIDINSYSGKIYFAFFVEDNFIGGNSIEKTTPKANDDQAKETNNDTGTTDITQTGPTKETFDLLNPLKQLSSGEAKDDFFTDGAVTPANIINRVMKFLFPIAGMILFVMLIWGGFEILGQAATKKSMDAGRQRITAAIGGFFLLFISYWLMQLIEVIFGVKIL